MTDFKDGFPSGKDAEWTLTALPQLWYENDSLTNKKKNNQPLTVKESNLKYWETKGVDDPHCILHGSQCTWGRLHNFKTHQWMTFTRMGPPAGILSHYFSTLGQDPKPKYECYSPFCVLFDGSSVAGPPSASKCGAALDCSRSSMKMGNLQFLEHDDPVQPLKVFWYTGTVWTFGLFLVVTTTPGAGIPR